MTAFDKDALEGLFKEVESAYAGNSEYERILRDVHLGVALVDAGQEVVGRIDPRAATVIKKHRPR
jgi:hypothetical protein